MNCGKFGDSNDECVAGTKICDGNLDCEDGGYNDELDAACEEGNIDFECMYIHTHNT